VADLDDLIAFLSASPSPYHAVAETARRLNATGFSRVDPTEPWPDGAGGWFVAQGGALVAWRVPEGGGPADPFRIVGAHTDSPNLRVKPRPDTGCHEWNQLAVEVYGGALWNSWLDRDLGLSGRVAVRGAAEPLLLRVERPVARVPQLAIHLDRGVNEHGLKLNPQQDLTPVWGTGAPEEGEFRAFVADELSNSGASVVADDVVSYDLMFHDLTRPARLGRNEELLASARLDDQLSCWAAVDALLGTEATASVPVVCLYDHEEVGSTSATGANGMMLADVLERIVLARGGDRGDLIRARSGSICASADGAHATHPNRPERHEPGHQIAIDGGPVIKVNANQRYATEAATAAAMVDACDRAGVPHQWFVSRNDQPCGSTIGPLTAARLGLATVDVGVAQLSMHSARELCGVDDPLRFASALAAFFTLTR
jgi:aspartyl aminopeptidase